MIGLRFWAVFSSEFSSSFHCLAFFPLSSLCGYIGNRILRDAYAPSSYSPLYFYSQLPSPALLLSPGSLGARREFFSSSFVCYILYALLFFFLFSSHIGCIHDTSYSSLSIPFFSRLRPSTGRVLPHLVSVPFHTRFSLLSHLSTLESPLGT